MSLETVDPNGVYVPTESGSEQLHGGSTPLSAAALALLVLFDGKKNLTQVIEAARGLAPEMVRRTAQALAREGYIEIARPEDEIKIDFSLLSGGQPAAPAADQASPEVQNEADNVAQTLSLSGYYVSIARRAGERKKPSGGSTYSVLVVEDNPEIQRSLKFILTFEQFEPRFAGNREEVVAALRKLPSPDVILLDVNLPDANGFDILARIRQHPALKSIPIIMLTAMATREDVVRGIAGGANGYITKPFEREHVLHGIRSVLGI